MQSDNLNDLIKNEYGSMTEATKKLQLKHRQDLYKYIEKYENGELEKIPEEVCRVFQKLSMKGGIESIDEMGAIAALKKKGDKLAEKRALEYMIRLAKEEISDLQESIEESENHPWMTGLQVSEQDTRKEAWKKSVEDDIGKLKDYIQQMEEEKKEIEKSLISTYDPYKRYESVDEKLSRLIAEGGYGGPSWIGKDFGTVCIGDSGEYMVIVDDIGADVRDLKLHLFAVIGGKRCRIATYEFNRNENFVRFRLIPKLAYYYEVRSRGIDADYTSGVIELTNNP